MNGLYDRLRKAWQAEKETEELQNIEDGFFPEMTNYVAELNSSPFTGDTPADKISLKEREYSNLMLKELSRMRLEKIVNSELKEMPIDSRALTPEEQTFHANIRRVITEFKQRTQLPKSDSPIIPRVEVKEKREKPVLVPSKVREKDEVELVVVRFLQPLPAIMGIDMKAYGPFKPEDVASIPQQNAVNLIRRGIAKLVEIEP
jgi:DNA replication factor GINS